MSSIPRQIVLSQYPRRRRRSGAAVAFYLLTVCVGCARDSIPIEKVTAPTGDRRSIIGESTGETSAVDSVAAPARIRVSGIDKGADHIVVELVVVDEALIESITRAQIGLDKWPTVLGVFVESEGESTAATPAMMGSYELLENVIRFVPRFPFEAGINYLVRFDPSWVLNGASAARAARPNANHTNGNQASIVARFQVPRPAQVPSTTITQIYPSGNQLPENQLKFYIHFSAPMSRGDAFDHIRLIDENGERDDLPFLEIDEELWDPNLMRFTLLFDPGRIKRGLKPREELGPTLLEGHSYTLAIDRQWRDAAGNPLVESVRKTFDVGPPDDVQPDPRTWTFDSPHPDSLDPLTLCFPEPLDRAMLERVISVTDPNARPIAGTISIGPGETRWSLTPNRPWLPGRYQIRVDTALEDRAGNSIARPFEVDMLRPIEQSIEKREFTIEFEVQSPVPSNE